MKIKYRLSSYVEWSNSCYTSFKSKDGLSAIYLSVNLKSKYWQVELCHELGHLYSAKNLSLCKHEEYKYDTLRIEMMAHRIAKSICKPKYWNEDFAMGMLLTYARDLIVPVNMDKLKKNGIIPLNKGLKIE